MNLSYGYIYRSVITSDENPPFFHFLTNRIKNVLALLENREEPDEEEDDGEEEEEEEEEEETRFVN